MIKRSEINKVTSAYYEIETMLSKDKDTFLNKEEIYSLLPKDEWGITYISISSFTNALRNMVRMNILEIAYVRGVAYYGIAERNNRL